MSKRKVLFILHLPPPIHGPAIVGRYKQESKIINDAFDIDYINLQTSRKLGQIGKGGLGKLRIFFSLYWNVLSALFRKRYDYCYLTINAHGPAFYKEMIIVFFLKLFRLKTIYYYHMKGVARFQDKWLPDKLYRFQFWGARTILLSPLIYYDVAKYAPKEEVFYCLEGIPDNARKSTEAYLEDRAQKETPEFLFLSNLMLAKGVYVLLGACKILHERGVKFRATFIGGPIDISKEEFDEFITTHGLEDAVSYVGPKYGDDKIEYFERVDFFVHPTLNDVQPLTILEALQYSLPVISTPEGTIPDMIKDDINGYVVPKGKSEPLADKIEFLVKNPGLRTEMSKRARQSFDERFTLQKFEENFVNAMNQAINHFEGKNSKEVTTHEYSECNQ